MMGNGEYAANAAQKIAAYQSDGLFLGESLIITFEMLQMPLTPEMIQKMIKHYFQ